MQNLLDPCDKCRDMSETNTMTLVQVNELLNQNGFKSFAKDHAEVYGEDSIVHLCTYCAKKANKA